MNVNAKNSPQSILVLGAGELGMAMLRGLSAEDNLDLFVLLRPATVTSHDPEKVANIQRLKALNVTITEGDLVQDSVATLADIFTQFDTVISCTGFIAGGGTQIKITQAVLQAGVRRYVPWQFGVDYDLIGKGSGQTVWDEQLDVRTLLRAQNQVEWVIISTGMFTSFLFDPTFGIVDLPGNKVNALGSWENGVTVTTPDDIGRLTREILLTQPPLRNEVVYTAGDSVTYQRLADLVDRVLNRRVTRTEWRLEKLTEDLAGAPEDLIAKYRVAFARGRGVSWPMAQTFNVQQHIAVTDVEQWMRQHFNLAE